MGPTELASILSKTVCQLVRKYRGVEEWKAPRETYSIWHVVRVFLVCALNRVCPGVLHARLESWPGYRRGLKLPNRLISLSQLKKRMRTPLFLKALLETLGQCAQSALKILGEEEVKIVAMDLTRIESDPDRDPHGAWGIDSQGYFWGYKLGLIISKNGVVLGATLMKGNLVEFSVNRRLLRMAADVVQTSLGQVKIDYVLCDAGFDGESTFKTSHEELGAPVLCPPKRKRNPRAKSARRNLRRAMLKTPHRFRDQALWQLEGMSKIFRSRGEIERVNGQLKDDGFRINYVPPCRRGVRRLFPLCLAKLIIYNLALTVNARHGRPLRRIKALVG